MSTKKSTKPYNISSQAKQASRIPSVGENLWWESEDHITDVVTHHRYVFAQTAGGSVEGSIFHSAWFVSWFLQEPHSYRAAPQTWPCTLVLAGRLSRRAGSNLSPKAKPCEESYVAHQEEPRNTPSVVRLVKRLWEPWGCGEPRTHPDAEAGRWQAQSSRLCHTTPSLQEHSSRPQRAGLQMLSLPRDLILQHQNALLIMVDFQASMDGARVPSQLPPSFSGTKWELIGKVTRALCFSKQSICSVPLEFGNKHFILLIPRFLAFIRQQLFILPRVLCCFTSLWWVIITLAEIKAKHIQGCISKSIASSAGSRVK